MNNWIEVAKIDELDSGTGRTVAAGDLRLALFNDDGRYYALYDTWSNEGASLGEGVLHDGRLSCPLHSWVFEAETGQCPRGAHESVKTYPTRCSGDAVEVQLPSSGMEHR